MVTIATMIWLLEVFGGSTSYSWRLLELAKSQFIGFVGVPEPPGSTSKHPNSRSIGLVDVPEPQGAQNSNSGGLEAAILDTCITFEASQGATSPNDRASTDL